jgi:hypothetical protein
MFVDSMASAQSGEVARAAADDDRRAFGFLFSRAAVA